MFDFYEKRKIKQWLYSWPFIVILIIISVFLIHGVWGVYQQERLTRINKSQRLEYLKGLKTREDALQKEINHLNTKRGMEEEIRQKFEVAKNGEKVIVIVEPPVSDSGVEDKRSSNIFDRILDSIVFWR